MRIHRRSFAALALAATLAACGGGDGHSGAESLSLSVGSTTVQVSNTGTITPAGTIAVTGSGAVPVSAVFRDGSGNALTLNPSEYQLSVTTPTGLTFNRTGAFAGTLLAASTGTYNVSVSLAHDGHSDFGPFSVPVRFGAP